MPFYFYYIHKALFLAPIHKIVAWKNMRIKYKVLTTNNSYKFNRSQL